MKIFVPILYLCVVGVLNAGAISDTASTKKQYNIERAVFAPKIDGLLDDKTWERVPFIDDFKQNFPYFGKPVSQRTEVKIVYDNTALYIAAMLYDNSPDSIARQLGNRDDALNADVFRIVFDTYNKEQDAFDFSVTASGVQLDSRFSDMLYNAVWESAVKISDKGWAVEIRIPYSALRFPKMEQQLWGMQITRNITRNGEYDQWSLTPHEESNVFKFWGYLKGMNGIREPIRLSVTPYIISSLSHYPIDIQGQRNFTSHLSGGLDLKYGINESFTIDASLLPDFSQVQSDNVIKNLSAFELTYDEQRPFFEEGTDLFQKGNLFYSRRIGEQPMGYYDVYSDTSKNKVVLTNPTQSKLLNATKITGRTPSGLGIGILNAVVGNTYARITDSVGNKSRILTEPFSNYNIIVFDQQLRNSSDVYLINTNVDRRKNYGGANVTGVGGSLNNKHSSYNLAGDFAISDLFRNNDTLINIAKDSIGFKYNLSFSKISGKFQYSLYRNSMNETYNNNTFGITRETNFNIDGLYLSYNQFKPYSIFLNSSENIGIEESDNFKTNRINSVTINLSYNATLKSYHNFYLGCTLEPWERVDYYEARSAGRVFIRAPHYYLLGGFNTDSRKKINISFSGYCGTTNLISPTIGYNRFYGFDITPRLRFNDRISFELTSNLSKDNGDRGYVKTDEFGTIVFGKRYLTDWTNSLMIKYLFRNNLSISLRGRHYWSRGEYKSYYDLSADGYLIDNISYNQKHDFNFNAFNIDMLFQWQFAPGSNLNLVWKNSIYNQSDEIINGYSHNFRNTIQSKQLNTISLKVLYYLDYLYLVKKQNK